jgi:hypothetical protein
VLLLQSSVVLLVLALVLHEDLLARARACARTQRPFEAWDPALRAWRP